MSLLNVAIEASSPSLFGAMRLQNTAAGPGLTAISVSGKGIEAAEIGDPVALDGGTASLAGMLVKMADNNGGLDFNAAYDSLHEMGDENVMVNYLYSRVGIPTDLGDGATLSDNMTSVAGKTAGAGTFNRFYDSLESLSDSESDNVTVTQLKDLLFTRNVISRHANEKPQVIEAGSGANLSTVTTTIDGNGNVATETYV